MDKKLDGFNLVITGVTLVGLSVPGYMIGRFIGNRKSYKMGVSDTMTIVQRELLKVLAEKEAEENRKED